MALLKINSRDAQWLEPPKLLVHIWPKTAKGRKLFLKSFLLIFVSAVIGALLSPRFVMQTTLYQEGDIIRENVVISEDMLLEDHVSTGLKGENLIKELGLVFDYDPRLFSTQMGHIQGTFGAARKGQTLANDALEALKAKRHVLGESHFRLNQDIQETTDKISGYLAFQEFLKSQLDLMAASPSKRDFIRKSKLDADLQITSKLLDELNAKLKRDRATLKTFPATFAGKRKEWASAISEIDAKRTSITTNFLKGLGVEVDESERTLLGFEYWSKTFESQLVELYALSQNRQIINDLKELNNGSGTPIVRNLTTTQDEPFSGPEQFIALDAAKEKVKQLTEEWFDSDENGTDRSLAVLLVQRLLRPTVTLNKQEFATRKDSIITSMSPVYFSVKKGEVVARAGDRATRHQVEVLQSYFEHSDRSEQLPKMFGTLLIVLFSLLLVYYVLQYKGGKGIPLRFLLLMSCSIILTLLLVKGASIVGDAISMRYTELDSGFYRYLFPVSLASLLVGILINYETALLAGLLTSLFASVMLQADLYFFFFSMTGCMVASMPITKFDSRHSLLNQGLKIAVAGLPAVLVILLIQKNELGPESISYFVASALGGFGSAVLVSVVLPLFETLFDITTNLRLLELSNMNHPALKSLIFNAPGTYQHSILVGNLSEAAAQRIGANPLLARVGAYYHDLGKGVDSQYFIENQPQNSTNIHDTLDNPLASARKIIDHLKEGAAIAERYRLGSLITEMITQHHGDGMVKYFYEKAYSAAKLKGLEDTISEADFRYPGPKPQSLEAGLIMLADAAEASTRSINQPTEILVQQMVQKVGWAILKDGQLDESGMNLQQFSDTLDCFTKVLISIHHHRIQYPEEVGLVASSGLPV